MPDFKPLITAVALAVLVLTCTVALVAVLSFGALAWCTVTGRPIGKAGRSLADLLLACWTGVLDLLKVALELLRTS